MKNHVRKFGERINEGFRKRLVGGRGQKREYDEMGEDQKIELARLFDELSPEVQAAFVRSLSKFGSIAEIRAALMSTKEKSREDQSWDLPRDRPASAGQAPLLPRDQTGAGYYFYGVPESRSARVSEGYWGAAMRLLQLEEELSALSTDALEDLRNFLEEPNMRVDLVRAVDKVLRKKSGDGEDLGFPGQMFPGPTRM
jgi:hypothetical protein